MMVGEGKIQEKRNREQGRYTPICSFFGRDRILVGAGQNLGSVGRNLGSVGRNLGCLGRNLGVVGQNCSNTRRISPHISSPVSREVVLGSELGVLRIHIWAGTFFIKKNMTIRQVMFRYLDPESHPCPAAWLSCIS